MSALRRIKQAKFIYMNNVQPNFEILKKCFYQAFYQTLDVDFLVLMETTKSKILLPSFSKRRDVFFKEFNEWLNHIDIRQAGELVLILKEQGKTMPQWLKDFRYNIDYNEKGFLDLIRIESINQ